MTEAPKPRPKPRPGAYIEVSWPGGGIGQGYYEVDHTQTEPVTTEDEKKDEEPTDVQP